MSSNFVPFTIPQDQLCFIHIPKTAGSTLTHMMKQVYDIKDVSPYIAMEEIRKLEPGSLHQYRYIGAHMRCSIRNYLEQEPAFITFLRDPVKRVISHYRFSKMLGDTAPFGPKLDSNSTIETYLQNKRFRFRVENQQTVYLGTDLLYENQPEGYNHYPIVTDEIYERAKETLESILFVGIQERFQESVNLLCRTLGWPAYREDRKINVTPGRVEDEPIPDHLLNEIRERNSYDIALYEFACELFDKRLKEISGNSSIMDEADRFYDELFKEQFPPSDTATYDFRYTPVGSNWHEAGRNPHGVPFRHMGPKTSSFVDLPLTNNKNLILSFDVLSTISQDMLDSLKVIINDTEIPCESINRQPGFTYTGKISKDILATTNGRVRITFTVNKTLSPKELGMNDDARFIGPAFSNLQIRPVAEPKVPVPESTTSTQPPSTFKNIRRIFGNAKRRLGS